MPGAPDTPMPGSSLRNCCLRRRPAPQAALVREAHPGWERGPGRRGCPGGRAAVPTRGRSRDADRGSPGTLLGGSRASRGHGPHRPQGMSELRVGSDLRKLGHGGPLCGRSAPPPRATTHSDRVPTCPLRRPPAEGPAGPSVCIPSVRWPRAGLPRPLGGRERGVQWAAVRGAVLLVRLWPRPAVHPPEAQRPAGLGSGRWPGCHRHQLQQKDGGLPAGDPL